MNEMHISISQMWKNRLEENLVFVQQAKLYDWYLQQCAAEYDLWPEDGWNASYRASFDVSLLSMNRRWGFLFTQDLMSSNSRSR